MENSNQKFEICFVGTNIPVPGSHKIKFKGCKTTLTSDQILEKMDLPFNYLYSKQESGSTFGITINQLAHSFECGIRLFYGLKLDDFCYPEFDLMEPKPNFLQEFVDSYNSTKN